jgi:hypothetical protein
MAKSILKQKEKDITMTKKVNKNSPVRRLFEPEAFHFKIAQLLH